MIPILVLAGPTAVGKTRVALEVAPRLRGEILVADSQQVYRGLDIGTAKPPPAERALVPHHLLDVADPTERYSAGRYAREAREAVEAVQARGRVPIVVGGAGLYLRALLEGLFPEAVPGRDREVVRQRLRQELHERGPEALHQRLAATDPVQAGRIHPHDGQRITRSLEVLEATGRPLSSWHLSRREAPPLRPLFCVLTLPRAELHAAIARRVEEMWARGLAGEVRGLLDRGLSPDLPALQSVGYREAIAFLRGEIGEAQAREAIGRRTRLYAKRQLTWFRGVAGARWVASGPGVAQEILSLWGAHAGCGAAR